RYQREHRQDGKRQDNPLRRLERQARGQARPLVRGHDRPRPAPLVRKGIPDLGRRIETDLHGDTRPARKHGSCAAANGRSERDVGFAKAIAGYSFAKATARKLTLEGLVSSPRKLSLDRSSTAALA